MVPRENEFKDFPVFHVVLNFNPIVAGEIVYFNPIVAGEIV